MNNRIRKAFAFLASAAMLLAGLVGSGLVGSGLVVPVYANTNVSDSTLVSKYPKQKITKAQLKKLQNQNWNVKSFSGKCRLKSVRSKRVNNGMVVFQNVCTRYDKVSHNDLKVNEFRKQ
jgi:hypothetical protein